MLSLGIIPLRSVLPWPSSPLAHTIDLQKKFRVALCGESTERITVARHQGHDLMGRLSKVQQGFVSLALQVGEVREVLQMRRHLLNFLPPLFDGIEIR